VGGPAAEVFRRCGSAFRAEGWRALEELWVEGGGEPAKLGRAMPGGEWLGAPLLTMAAYVASSCCKDYRGAEGVYMFLHV